MSAVNCQVSGILGFGTWDMELLKSQLSSVKCQIFWDLGPETWHFSSPKWQLSSAKIQVPTVNCQVPNIILAPETWHMAFDSAKVVDFVEEMDGIILLNESVWISQITFLHIHRNYQLVVHKIKSPLLISESQWYDGFHQLLVLTLQLSGKIGKRSWENTTLKQCQKIITFPAMFA